MKLFMMEQNWYARILEIVIQTDQGEFATDAEVMAALAAWGEEVNPAE